MVILNQGSFFLNTEILKLIKIEWNSVLRSNNEKKNTNVITV